VVKGRRGRWVWDRWDRSSSWGIVLYLYYRFLWRRSLRWSGVHHSAIITPAVEGDNPPMPVLLCCLLA